MTNDSPSNDDLDAQLINLLGQPNAVQEGIVRRPTRSPAETVSDTTIQNVEPETAKNAGELDGILDRLNQLTAGDRSPSRRPAAAPPVSQPRQPATARPGSPARPAAVEGAAPAVQPRRRRPVGSAPSAQAIEPAPEAFFPREPRSLEEAGVNRSSVEEIILKFLLSKGEESGQGISEQLKLPFTIISELLSGMKYDQLLHYRDTTSLNDYVVSLTDMGRERARRYSLKCTYYGSIPVQLGEYIASVEKQSLQHQKPGREDLERAFSDLLINKGMFLRLGAAMNSGRGMFLFGYPGNGKTSIAERVTKAFGEHIWLPRSIAVEGEIIRVYDPTQHVAAPLESSQQLITEDLVDRRWIRVKRPTIVVGGELTMANLELSHNPATGINEAPFQLKSNCGTLVIDDFGRQRMTTDELLNRWIVPLEKRYDFLNLPSGKKVQVPFDQLVIFSTNLEPKDLVDDAFLRRIPYKIEVKDPTEEEFRELFKIMCPIMGFEHDEKAITHLIETHYKPTNRPFRNCQPRDLLLQIRNFCQYLKTPIVLSCQNFDFAAANYFAVM